ncbi:MAG: TonB-dependent receptor, partial [Bacteroidales bacterium]|nr:TonB-dependent receptor [Bacteroidales bacterium]
NSAKNGSGLIVPNVYTVQNISSASLNYSSALYERAVNSVYGLANFGWRDMVYLDLTARNDWSSTLPAENNSYFYPSASLSFLVNEAFDLGRNVNMLKLRGGWAQVGNDTSPYSLTSVYGDSGQWGDAIRLNKPGTLLTPDLKPEQATSKEIGVEARVFNNRLRFDGTYYQVENRNQILGNIPLAASSGFSNIKLNTGLLDNQGVELMLGVTPVRTNDWNWDLNINFTKNETIIRELAEGVEFIQFWGDNKMDARGYAYDPEAGHNGLVGNLYAPLKKKVTDENSPYYGYPIVSTATGNGWIPEEEPSLIGNYNPDFIMGLQSQLRFKNFTLSATFDWRSGGQYVSQTYRYYGNHAQTQTWLDNNLVHPGDRGLGKELRDWVVANDDWLVKTEEMLLVGGPTPDYGGFPEALSGITVYDGLFSPGVLGYHDDDGNFILVRENLGNEGTNIFPYILSNPWDFGTQNVFDADYIKLREVSLGFQLPQSIANSLRVKSASISVYSRNIMLWTKDSDFGTDPERAYQAESSTGNRGMQFKQGIERYNVDPRVIPIGFRLDLNF